MIGPLILVTLLIRTVVGGGGDLNYKAPETSVILSCLSLINRYYEFDYTSDNFWDSNCLYPPKVATFTTCFEESGVNFDASLKTFLIMCHSFGGVNVSSDDLYEIHKNGTHYLIDPSKGDEVELILYRPVAPDPLMVITYNNLYSSFFNSMNRATDFGNLINLYWIAVLLIISAFNFVKSTRLNNVLQGKIMNNIRSAATIPTLHGKSHLQSHNFLGICETLLPTSQEFYLLAIYLIVCIYGASTNYRIYKDNPLFGDRFTQWARFIADRTGILAFTQLPLLFLFGGRNNVLIQMTGLQYNSFIIFHKWISRSMFACASIHGTGYMLYAYHFHNLKNDFMEQYWVFGCIALSACLGIMIQAIYKFRKICYEWFLLIHIALLFVFIISCVVHCWSIGWLQWCYYAMGFWGFDRVLRIWRLLKFGFPLATVEILSTLDPTLKISVPKPANYKTFPGCYVFIHFLHLNFKFWESHPFTIFENDDHLVIILKPKLGMTLNLYKHLLLIKDQKVQLRVAIEGPYGHHVPKKYYQQVLLLAGGNGIPGPFYHALSMLQAQGNNELESGISKIKLCWVIRDLESLNWFSKELQLIADKQIDIEIYVTREKLPLHNYGTFYKTESNGRRGSSVYYSLLQKSSNIKFFNLRPDFAKMMRNEVIEKELRSLNIISCGNPIMCDVIRNSCGELMREFNGVRIDLFEELQVW